jgi:hypothetical protein
METLVRLVQFVSSELLQVQFVSSELLQVQEHQDHLSKEYPVQYTAAVHLLGGIPAGNRVVHHCSICASAIETNTFFMMDHAHCSIKCRDRRTRAYIVSEREDRR